jgi:hypothetical protein
MNMGERETEGMQEYRKETKGRLDSMIDEGTTIQERVHSIQAAAQALRVNHPPHLMGGQMDGMKRLCKIEEYSSSPLIISYGVLGIAWSNRIPLATGINKISRK